MARSFPSPEFSTDVIQESGRKFTERFRLWFTQLDQKMNAPSGGAQTVTGVSPITITNTFVYDLSVFVSGGAGVGLSYSRNGATFPVGAASGEVRLSPGDSLVVTYTSAPTINIINR